MFSASKLLGGMVTNGLGGAAKGMMGGSGFGRGAVGVAAGAAGIAGVGGLAYMAYNHFKGGQGQSGPQRGVTGAQPAGFPGQSGGFGSTGPTAAAAAGFGAPQAQQPAPTPTASATPWGAGSPAPPTAEHESQALLLVRAMIAAAHVDGHLDASERQHILDSATRSGLGQAEHQALMNELRTSHLPHTLLGQVHDPEMARQFYLVTLLAIVVDSDRERDYVRGLPPVLGLSPQVVSQVHQQLGLPL